MASILAIDIGGTKTLAALVDGSEIMAEREIATPRNANADEWLTTLATLVQPWQGEYDAVGAAVTGLIDNGCWSALNPSTLPVPGGLQLQQRLSERLESEVLAVNDAQAAAWGEYQFGAGCNRDIVYLTISTGIGGGVIIDGKLLTGRNGLAGSAGQLRLLAEHDEQRIEDIASGQWIASQAMLAGHPGTAKSVFAAAANGQAWAERIIAESANAGALLLRNLQLLLAPERIIIGGSIGLAEGYMARLNKSLTILPLPERPELHAAALGKHAGIIGVADLVRHTLI